MAPVLFDKNYLDYVRSMREKFFSSGSVSGIADIRPEILACWETYFIYKQMGDAYQEKAGIQGPEFQEVLRESKELLSVAEPYMIRLQSFLQSDSFWITLMNKAGIIIKIMGDAKIVETARSTGFYEGSYRGAGSYPGLFAICKELDQPFQMVSTEHPSPIDDDLAGAAAPIHELNTGRFLGAIGISGYWWNSHIHTLGLTIMAAEGISHQIALGEKNKIIKVANRDLDIALESVGFGLIYFSRDGRIRLANRQSIELLGEKVVSKAAFRERNLFSYFEEDGPFTRETMERMDLSREGEYVCDAIPKKRYRPVHCVIKRTSEQSYEYVMQLQKAEDFNKTVANAVFPKARFKFQDIIGESAAIESVRNSAKIAALHSPSVLITGESGTGKELFAQSIHNHGPRAKGPFVAINCGAIPKSLIESELFGYEAGAFTGAQRTGQQGKFELADKGTIFLDEIGDMPYETQVSLLRVIQAKEVVRIGGKTPIKIDVQIIAATNQNLEERIKDRSFREDLYYRLNVFNIRLPALRERRGDIALLCTYFIEKYGCTFDRRISGISEEALQVLRQYDWPGNVRELENTIERAVIVCETQQIDIGDLPARLSGALSSAAREAAGTSEGAPDIPVKSQREAGAASDEERLRELLEAYAGNLSEVARQEGISRPTLYRKLKKYGLYPPKKQYGSILR